MNRPLTLEKTVVLSFALHVIFFALASFLPRIAVFNEEQVYVVQLVSQQPPAAVSRVEEPATTPKPEPKQAPAPPVPLPKPAKPREPAQKKDTPGKEPEKGSQAYREARERRIRELREEQEKRLAEERAGERIREIREAARVDALKRQAGDAAAAPIARPQAKTKSLTGYTKQVEALIKQNWLYTLTSEERQLMTEVSITVLKDGAIRLNRIERPSGNRAFDLSALKAVRKTRSVDPPPNGREIEIVLRFTPDEQ